MSLSISTITLTQPDLTVSDIHYSFTVTESTSALTTLAYKWCPVGGTPVPATTTGPTTVTTNGTTHTALVTGVWHLGSDYFGTAGSHDFMLEVDAKVPGSPSTGSFTAHAADPATGIVVGDTIWMGPELQFTTPDRPVPPQSGDKPIVLPSATATADQVKAAIIAGVNAMGYMFVATSGPGEEVIITDPTGGQQPLHETLAHSASGVTLSPTGLTGGLAEVAYITSNSGTFVIAHAGEPHDVLPVDNLANTVESYKLDQFGKYGAGVLPQAYLKKSIVYEMLDLLRSGERSKFEFIADRAGLHQRRAVLISVAEYNRVRGTASIEVSLKSKQWLAYYANKAMSTTTFFDHDKRAYAVSENKIVNGAVIQTVIGYLLSGALYTSLAD
jgi:hypothetical protein